MSTLEMTRPRVLIVGAGLGGITLGALLEKAGVPYCIFERGASSSPIGSAISLGASVMPMFKQLGIYDELKAIAKLSSSARVYDAQGKLILQSDRSTGFEEMFSFPGMLFSRPALYDLLLAQIPTDKILYRKKMLSYKEKENGVVISFSDNTSIEGNILVGADGANSAVRQNMYRQLGKMGSLPPSDKLPLKYSSISLVGQTRTLDPEKYPWLKSTEWNCESVLSKDQPFFSVAFPTAHNTICWMVVQILDKESSKLHDSFRNSEWGPEAADEMAQQEDVRSAKFPGLDNATMGDLIDLTSKELMSKVMLEEKCFKTWYHSRAILIGDACHKMTPAAGQGALNAMLDALVLANYIETLRGDNLEEIKAISAAYKEERFGRAKAAVDASAMAAMLTKNGWASDILRAIMNNLPQCLWFSMMKKAGEYRPQAAFLPPAEDNGSVKSLYQPSLYLPGSTRPSAVL